MNKLIFIFWGCCSFLYAENSDVFYSQEYNNVVLAGFDAVSDSNNDVKIFCDISTERKASSGSCFFSFSKQMDSRELNETKQLGFNYILPEGIYARLICYSLDDSGQQIFTDTFNLVESKILRHLSVPVNQEKTKTIHFLVEGGCVNGNITDTLTIQSAVFNRNKPPTQTNSHLFDYNIDSIVSKHRIIALGESIHGSKTFNDFAFDFMKNSIINDSVRLVFLELSYTQLSLINLYINNQIYLNLDSVIGTMPYLVDNISFKDFVFWLKSYNTNHKSGVRIAGLETINDIADQISFARLVEKMALGESKRIDSLIMHGIFNPTAAKEYLQNNFSFFKENLLNVEIITPALFYSETYKKDLYCYRLRHKVRNRDYNMFRNAQYELSNLPQIHKAIIYCHLQHANKTYITSMYPTDKSMGHYLYQQYGGEYTVVALLAQQGTYVTQSASSQADSIVYRLRELEDPIKTSLEFKMSECEQCFICEKNIETTIRRNANYESENAYPFQIVNTSNFDYVYIVNAIYPISYSHYPKKLDEYVLFKEKMKKQRRDIIMKYW